MSDERQAVTLFMFSLGVAEPIAMALARAGWTTLEEVAYVPQTEFLESPGLAPDILMQLRTIARARLAVTP